MQNNMNIPMIRVSEHLFQLNNEKTSINIILVCIADFEQTITHRENMCKQFVNVINN